MKTGRSEKTIIVDELQKNPMQAIPNILSLLSTFGLSSSSDIEGKSAERPISALEAQVTDL